MGILMRPRLSRALTTGMACRRAGHSLSPHCTSKQYRSSRVSRDIKSLPVLWLAVRFLKQDQANNAEHMRASPLYFVLSKSLCCICFTYTRRHSHWHLDQMRCSSQFSFTVQLPASVQTTEGFVRFLQHLQVNQTVVFSSGFVKYE